MMNVINGGAHAANSIDLQEFMVVPVGASTRSPRRCGSAPRPTTRSRRCCSERGLATAVGDEGGFAPDLRVERGRDRGDPRGGRARRAIATGSRSRSTRRRASSSPTASTASKGARRRRAEMVDFWAELVDRYPIVSIEDGHAEDDWDGWAALDRASSATASSSSATTSSSPTRSACSEGIDARRRELDPRQGQPDRHADRDDRRDALAQTNGYTRGDVAPLGRDGGRDDRRPRGRARDRARSRPARPRAPTAWRSTTSCCASRRSSAPRAVYPGLGRVSAGAAVT